MAKELDNGTATQDTDSFDVKLFKDHPHLDTPEFREHYARVKADQLEAYRNRPKPKFSELPFVGKKYRSRNRRSADKLTAWAVKPEQGAMAAVQGYEYARQFLHHINALSYADRAGGREPWAGYGISLENIVIGMADTLANCKPIDKGSHLKVIRGFCSVLEMAAIHTLDGNSPDEKHNAASYMHRLAHLASHEPNVYDCGNRHRSCEVEKRLMLLDTNERNPTKGAA